MRKVFLITERRADYSRFKPILDLIHSDPLLTYDLVVTGLHLKEEHGSTIEEIRRDGFNVTATFPMFLESADTGASMTRAFAEALRQVTYELEKSRPDIILSGFDIAANAAVTIAAAHMNIPVAHIQGGEVTGTIDESIRHAMSKFAHYHFAANNDACTRLIKMGERPDSVFNVGCPSIDAMLSVGNNDEILEKFDLKDNFLLMIQHPVTTEVNLARSQIETTLASVKSINIDALVIMPNNDAGYSSIIDSIKDSNIKFVESLSIDDYVNLLKRSSVLVGNSSSGIHEAATFNIPVVNIGTRQQGRLRPENVIDVDHEFSKIKSAIEEGIHIKRQGRHFDNPYGNGNSAPKIVELLKNIDISNNIIQKRITY